MELLSEINKKKYNSIAEEVDGEYPKIMKEMQDTIGNIQNYGKEPEKSISDTEIIFSQFERTLKDYAYNIVHYSKNLSNEERKEKLQLVEDITKYIRGYKSEKEQSKEQKPYKQALIEEIQIKLADRLDIVMNKKELTTDEKTLCFDVLLDTIHFLKNYDENVKVLNKHILNKNFDSIER